MSLAFLPEQPQQPTEILVSIDPELIVAMNRWRLAQTPVQTPNEAIISLIRRGLEAEGQLASAARQAEDPQFAAMVQALREAAGRQG